LHHDLNYLDVASLACVRGEQPIFSGLDFSARAADVLHLQGRNGSGKTSLLRILCGLAEPASGTARWNGEDIRQNADDFCRDVGYIGHRRGVCEDLTPLENVEFASALKTQKSDTECREALARVELTHVAEIPTYQLSAGQNQRTALACLLVRDASLWFLDEPFTSLDTDGQTIIETLIAEHSNSGGISIIASHSPLLLSGIEVKPLRLDPP